MFFFSLKAASLILAVRSELSELGEDTWVELGEDTCTTCFNVNVNDFLPWNLKQCNSAESIFEWLENDEMYAAFSKKMQDLLIALREVNANQGSEYKCIEFVSIFGESHKYSRRSEMDGKLTHADLNAFPGEIDRHLMYTDGKAFSEPKKSLLLLDHVAALQRKGIFAERNSEAAFFADNLRLYHTHIGVLNDNFLRVYEAKATKVLPAAVLEPHLENVEQFLRAFAEDWRTHLSEFHPSGASNEYVVITSRGGTAHMIFAKNFCDSHLELGRGSGCRVVYEEDLGADPLEIALGIPSKLVYTYFAQKKGDAKLAKTLNKLHDEFQVFLPDIRMDTLRQKVGKPRVVVNMITHAHAFRLAADGLFVVQVSTDEGQINGQIHELALQHYEFNYQRLLFVGGSSLMHVVLPTGEKRYVADSPTFDVSRMPLAVLNEELVTRQGDALNEYLRPSGSESQKELVLLTIAFGGSALTQRMMEEIFVMVEDFVKDEHERDVRVFWLAGGAFDRCRQFLIERESELMNDQEQMSEVDGAKVTGASFKGTNYPQLIHTVWRFIESRELIKVLTQSSDIMVSKSGAATSQEIIAYGGRGVIVRFMPDHSWELGNFDLLEAHGVRGVIGPPNRDFLLSRLGVPLHAPSELQPGQANMFDVVEKWIEAPVAMATFNRWRSHFWGAFMATFNRWRSHFWAPASWECRQRTALSIPIAELRDKISAFTGGDTPNDELKSTFRKFLAEGAADDSVHLL